MIYIYTGTPGSGKSYNVVRDIYKYLKRGKNVILNFPLNEDSRLYGKCKGNYVYKKNEELSVDFLLEYSCKNHKRNEKGGMIEKQTLLVVDECQNMFNSRTWNAPDRADWNLFFTQHRKFGYTVILVSQYIEMVDKQIRGCIQTETNFRNLKMFGLFGLVLSLLLGGNVFVAVEKSCQINKRGFVTYSRGKKKFCDLYDSYKIFDKRLISKVERYNKSDVLAVEEN